MGMLSDTQLDRREHLIRTFRNVRTALWSNRLPWFARTARGFNVQIPLMFFSKSTLVKLDEQKATRIHF